MEHFHGSEKKKIYTCMHEIQNTNCVIWLFHIISKMLLYLHLKLEFHDVKMNSENHTDYLKF